MRTRFSAVAAGAATLLASAGIVLAGAGVANAATPPPYEPDPFSQGTISFYDASGNQITSGSINDDPMAAYAVASQTLRAGDIVAQLQAAQPNPTKTTDAWSVDTLSSTTAYPVTTGPSNIQTMSQTHPVVTGASSDLTLADFIAEFPNDPAHDSNTSYQNLYQLRLYTGSPAGQPSPAYAAADVLVSGNTWTQVYPTVKSNTTTTVASSKNPSYNGDTVTYTATVSGGSSPTGTVAFTDNGTTISGCGSQALSSGGTATCSTSYSSPGSHTIVATYSGDSNNNGSSGQLTQQNNAPATPTTTALSSANASSAQAGDPVDFSATVSPSAAAGSVSFFADGSTTAITGCNNVAVSGGAAACHDAAGFTQGSHSVVAKFTPTDATQYQASQSAPLSFFTNAKAASGSTCSQTGSNCTDTQTIQGTVPTGTLVISTPYTDTNPLDVGTLALNPAGTEWTGSATFRCITITDSSSGGSPFIASALANPLSQVAGTGNPAQNTSNAYTAINGENVGLTGLAPSTGNCPDGSAPVNSYTNAITATDNPAADPAVSPSDGGSAGLGGTPHQILKGTSGGVGTATYDGTLTLSAPTATAAGTYKGTVVFTVTD